MLRDHQPPEAAAVMARSLHADPLFFYKLLLPAHSWGRLIASLYKLKLPKLPPFLSHGLLWLHLLPALAEDQL